MTCKDCKSRHTCTNPNKSYEYEEDGDSLANWCDEFSSIHKSKTVVKDGLRITQSGYNFHIMVVDNKTDKPILHSSCTEKLSKKELERYANFVKTKLKELNEK